MTQFAKEKLNKIMQDAKDVKKSVVLQNLSALLTQWPEATVPSQEIFRLFLSGQRLKIVFQRDFFDSRQELDDDYNGFTVYRLKRAKAIKNPEFYVLRQIFIEILTGLPLDEDESLLLTYFFLSDEGAPFLQQLIDKKLGPMISHLQRLLELIKTIGRLYKHDNFYSASCVLDALLLACRFVFETKNEAELLTMMVDFELYRYKDEPGVFQYFQRQNPSELSQLMGMLSGESSYLRISFASAVIAAIKRKPQQEFLELIQQEEARWSLHELGHGFVYSNPNTNDSDFKRLLVIAKAYISLNLDFINGELRDLPEFSEEEQALLSSLIPSLEEFSQANFFPKPVLTSIVKFTLRRKNVHAVDAWVSFFIGIQREFQSENFSNVVDESHVNTLAAIISSFGGLRGSYQLALDGYRQGLKNQSLQAQQDKAQQRSISPKFFDQTGGKQGAGSVRVLNAFDDNIRDHEL